MKLALAALTLVVLSVLVVLFFQDSGPPTSVSALAPEAHGTREPSSPRVLETTEFDSQEREAADQNPAPSVLLAPRTVQVVVRSQTGRGSNKRDLPHVAFELGTGQKGDFPREVLLRAETDALGEWRMKVELPSLDVDEQVFVRPLEPGYSQHIAWMKLREDDGEHELVLRLEEGCTIRGRVLNQAGEPEPGTRVFFRFEHPKQRPFPSGWFARTDSQGRFELHNRFEGRGYIRARKRGVGNALIDELDFLLACGQDEEFTLKLAGSGILAGRVITPDGLTIDHLTVEVRMVGVRFAGATNETAHTGNGLVGAQMSTTENGEFRFTGLESGTFEFWTHGNGAGWKKLSVAPVETDREHIELVVPAHRLELTVLEHDGTPAAKVGWFQSDEQSDYPTIECSWRRATDRAPIWHGVNPGIGRGQTQGFAVEPGWTLRFAAFSLSGRTEYQEVTFGETDWLIERTLRLPPPREPGTLAVTLESSDGGEFAFMVITVTDETGTQVHRSLISESPSQSQTVRAIKLTPGNYTLTARVSSAYRYDLARTTFELEPAEHVELNLVAQRGGLLELTVTAEEAPRDSELAALYAESTAWGGAHIWPNIVGASLRDVNADHPYLSVQATDHDSHASWIPLGNTALIDHALPPGDHLIEVRYPGYVPALVPVTIRVGSTAQATVELVPL